MAVVSHAFTDSSEASGGSITEVFGQSVHVRLTTTPSLLPSESPAHSYILTTFSATLSRFLSYSRGEGRARGEGRTDGEAAGWEKRRTAKRKDEVEDGKRGKEENEGRYREG